MEVISAENYVDGGERLQILTTLFQERYGHRPDIVVRVPGRVNLIGEHIDHCGYAVHPMAIDRDILVAVSKCKDGKLHLCNKNKRFADFFMDLNGANICVEKNGANWWNYFLCGVKGVMEEIAKDTTLDGINCFVDGTIPPSAGLSSSSALVVAAALVTLWVIGEHSRVSRSEVANLCARSERFIGTQGGGMDHAIELLAKEGTAKLIEFNPLTTTDVKLPRGATFVIANSLAEMNKALGTQFNTRAAEIRLAAKLVGKLTGLKNWRAVQLQKFKLLGNDLSGLAISAKELLHHEPYSREEVCRLLGVNEDELMFEFLNDNTRDLVQFKLQDRIVHVFSEASRVYRFKSICDEAASASWTNSEEIDSCLRRLGQLMFESHHSCSVLYECSHPQLDQLVALSKKYGALGARLTGAGWGGCIVALVPNHLVDDYIAGLQKEYYNDLPAAQSLSRNEYIFPAFPGSGAEIYYL